MDVDCYVDFACGWSKTLTEAYARAEVEPTWKPFSLHLRDGPMNGPQGLRREAANRALRVMAALGESDPAKVAAYYEAMMEQGASKPPYSDAAGALEAAGADPSLAAAADDESWDDVLQATIDSVREMMGGEASIPITVIDGTPMSGPLFDEAPSAEDAAKAWDAVVAAASVPVFFGFTVPHDPKPKWARDLIAARNA